MNPSVLLTRSEEDIKKDKPIFESRGLRVISLPLIAFEPVPFEVPSEKPDWIVFQSPRAVEFFLKRSKIPDGVKIAVVGEKTKKVAQDHRLKVDFVPSEMNAEGIAKELPVKEGQVIWIPRSSKGRVELIDILREKGAKVFPIDVYTTVNLIHPKKEVLKKLRGADYVVFASPSAVKGLLVNLQKEEILSIFKEKTVVAVGKTTKAFLEKEGFKVHLVPQKPLMEEVAGKIHEHWQENCTK